MLLCLLLVDINRIMNANKGKVKFEPNDDDEATPPSDKFDTNSKPKKQSSSTIISPIKVEKGNANKCSANEVSVNPSSSNEATTLCHATVETTSVASTCSCGQNKEESSTAARQKKDEKSFFVSKIIYKTDNLSKKKDLTLKLNQQLGYTKVNDDPNKQQVALELFASDYTELELTEIGDDDIEPRYEVFGDNQPLCRDHADISAEWKINNNCQDCYLDCCDEWRFGDYCVSAVKRYWDENSHTASVKEAYIHFVAHYNRVLDWHSFGDGSTNKLRKSQVTKPPYCMKKGSLRFAIQWIKWQIENGSEKEWYTELRKRKWLETKEKAAVEEERQKEFKIRTLNTYRYGDRKKRE